MSATTLTKDFDIAKWVICPNHDVIESAWRDTLNHANKLLQHVVDCLERLPLPVRQQCQIVEEGLGRIILGRDVRERRRVAANMPVNARATAFALCSRLNGLHKAIEQDWARHSFEVERQVHALDACLSDIDWFGRARDEQQPCQACVIGFSVTMSTCARNVARAICRQVEIAKSATAHTTPGSGGGREWLLGLVPMYPIPGKTNIPLMGYHATLTHFLERCWSVLPLQPDCTIPALQCAEA